jgi:probable HAF family extracellular repeat protein
MWSQFPRILVIGVASLVLSACGGGDGKHHPAPVATGLSPASTTVEGPAFTLTVSGTGFVSKSVVQWDGAARPTVYVSSTELQAAISATDIAEGGARSVTVYNPPPGGGTSSSLTFTVEVPPPVVQLSSSATEVPAGQSITLTWTSRYAKTCVATGSWTGAKATSGTERIGPLSTASRIVLECRGSGGTRSAEILVIIALPKYSWIGLPFWRAAALNEKGDATGNLYRKEAGVMLPYAGIAYINGATISFDFGNTSPPVYRTLAGDINTRQEVLVGTNLPYCYIYRAGSLIPMAAGDCAAINDRGHVAGSVRVDQGGQPIYQAALYVDGVFVPVDMPPATNSYGQDLNESDQMVGFFHAGGDSSAPHAFLYSGGRMTDLGTLGGQASYAWAINETGVVVGQSTLADGHIHAFRYDASGMADLGTLGGDYSAAYGINDSGAVVGEAQRADGWRSAFLFDYGWMYDLNEYLVPALEHRLYGAADINNLGQILTNACWTEALPTTPPFEVCGAYLLTPIPGSSDR